jgi:hypothetical protein
MRGELNDTVRGVTVATPEELRKTISPKPAFGRLVSEHFRFTNKSYVIAACVEAHTALITILQALEFIRMYSRNKVCFQDALRINGSDR